MRNRRERGKKADVLLLHLKKKTTERKKKEKEQAPIAVERESIERSINQGQSDNKRVKVSLTKRRTGREID